MIGSAVRRWLSDLGRVVFPTLCEVCGRPLVTGETLMCLHCRSAMPCVGAVRPAEMSEVERRLCTTDLRVERARSMFYYVRGDSYGAMIRKAKYAGRPWLLRQLAEQFGHVLIDEDFFEGMDIICPVPMHWTKRMLRGYNQADYVAQGLSNVSGIGVGQLLKTRRPHRAQAGMGADERLASVKDLYVLTSEGIATSPGRHVLLVDDVLTTGATLRECASILARCGASVSVATIGLAQSD